MDDDEGDIRPIEVVDPSELPGADAQALAAATFTLMTAYALAQQDGERASTAAQISANLEMLEELPGLGSDFRRLCGRLRALWAAQAEPDDPRET